MTHRLLLAAIVLFGWSLAQAHHSFSATYFVDEEIIVEGRLVAFLFRNPHSFLHLNVTDGKGVTIRWAVEWGAPQALIRQSVGRDTLRPGDEVIIVGSPGRNPEDHRLRMRSIERPADGWAWAGNVD